MRLIVTSIILLALFAVSIADEANSGDGDNEILARVLQDKFGGSGFTVVSPMTTLKSISPEGCVLNLSIKTIGTYMEKIKDKQGLKNYTQLVKMAANWADKILK